MWFGVGVNLAVLGFFKYTNFLVDNLNAVIGTDWHIGRIILPLGISFFTFQKVAYLVDAWRGKTREHTFGEYCLFVCFFPQLIAGPIVHHSEMLPQFKQAHIFRFNPTAFAAGITWFTLGLCKKTIFADGIAGYSTSVFGEAAQGTSPGMWAAWGAALAYACQVYYDFSGYTDMAIGLGQMFGIRLPVNFNSPYQAANIIDFWRRWHITLSTFLRDYLYIPLGGNRLGSARRYMNVFITMLLGGIWHGASWTFVVWGALHGVYLMINHAWVDLRRGSERKPTFASRVAAKTITFLAVLVAWVFFRADSMSTALRMLGSMVDLGSAHVSAAEIVASWKQIAATAALLCWAWFAPNTQQWLARAEPAPEPRPEPINPSLQAWTWRPGMLWAGLTAGFFVLALLHLSRITEFLYFQF
jgi:alginate O-acetyltransferase complex protein AlgI